jgi:hypothetical protein
VVAIFTRSGGTRPREGSQVSDRHPDLSRGEISGGVKPNDSSTLDDRGFYWSVSTFPTTALFPSHGLSPTGMELLAPVSRRPGESRRQIRRKLRPPIAAAGGDRRDVVSASR